MPRDRSHDPAERSKLNPLPRFFARHFAEGVVTEATTVGPRWRAIRVRCLEMARLKYEAGQHVRIELRDPFSVYGILRPAETMRTYTIWHWDEREQIFELRVHLHDGDGIGVRWAQEAQAGDAIRFWGPQGDFLLKPAAFHLFVGDETALPAIGPLMRAAGPTAQQMGIVEVDTLQDRLPLLPSAAVQWLLRDGASAIASHRLLAAVSATDLPEGGGMAYIAGEAKTCQMIRHHLVTQRGWPRSNVQVKPFWASGKRGLH